MHNGDAFMDFVVDLQTRCCSSSLLRKLRDVWAALRANESNQKKVNLRGTSPTSECACTCVHASKR
jgi:hypothetical protein